jgi:hypothetical protein
MFEIKPDLTKENILARVSEIDIFRHYCNNFVRPGVNFCSDLRKDSQPSCRIDNYQGRIYYKDFAEKGALSCIDYVMKKYHCNYITALDIVNKDFQLNLDGDYVQKEVTKKAVINNEQYPGRYAEHSEIRVQYKEWEEIHINYIKSYYLDYRRVSTFFRVNPIAWYWINGKQFRAKKLAFAYYFGIKDNMYKYKLYQPGQVKYKWTHNLDNTVIQGLSQLPNSGEGIVITKAYKDVWCYDLFNIPSIAPPAEGWEIPDTIMDNICERFPVRIVQYDWDRTGIGGMNRLKRRYGVIPIPILQGNHSRLIKSDRYWNSKDFSDYLQKDGPEALQEEINIVKYKLGLI